MPAKKLLSTSLIISQIFMSWNAYATPSSIEPSAEFTLLQSVLTMQGEDLSRTQMNSQVEQAISQYLNQAKLEGSQDRFEQALIQMGIYTPTQAQAFMSAAQTSVARVAGESSTSTDQQAKLMTAEISQLSALRPEGAQFSACDLFNQNALIAAGVVEAAALSAFFIGVTEADYNPSCSITGYDNVGDSIVNCTSDEHPHAVLGHNLMIYGGIVAAVIALTTWYVDYNCS